MTQKENSDYEEQSRRKQAARSKRQEASGKRQEAGGKKQKAKRKKQGARDKELEEDIANLEAQLEALGEELVAASASQDVEKLRELGLEYQRVDEELQWLLAQWAEVSVA